MNKLHVIFALYILFTAKSKQCFDEPPPTLYYKNSNKPIDFGGPIKIHSGGWDSQSTANMFARILLKEKVGLNVTFYPPFPEEDTLYLKDDFNHEWSAQWHPLNYLHGQSYWFDYYKWCADAHADAFFELNSFHITNESNLIYSPNGMIETLGWFIPSRLAEPMATIATSFRNFLVNDTLRNITYDPAYNASVIWGSIESYFISQTSMKMLQYHNLSLAPFNWTIVFLKSDVALLRKIEELTAKGKELVFISWTPSMHTSSDSYVPINWPFNPSGLQTHSCVAQGKCGFADDNIKVGICQHLDTRDSKAYVFLDDFRRKFLVSRQEVNDMMETYRSEKTDLFDSVCNWIKNNTGVWEPWLQNLPSVEDLKPYKFSYGWKITVMTCSAALGFALILLGAAVILARENKIVKRLHIPLTLLWISANLAACFLPPLLVVDTTVDTCIAFTSIYIFVASFVLSIPGVKAWRLSVLFSSGFHAKTISNVNLYGRLGLVLLVDICIIIPLAVIQKLHGLKRKVYTDTNNYEESCNIDELFEVGCVALAWQAVIVFTLLYYAYKSRNAWEPYNEAKWLASVSCFAGCLTLLNVLVGTDSDIAFFTWRGLMIIFTFLFIVIIVGSYVMMTMWRFINEEQEKEEKKNKEDKQEKEVTKILDIISQLDPKGLALLRTHLEARKKLDTLHNRGSEVALLRRKATAKRRATERNHGGGPISSSSSVPSEIGEEYLALANLIEEDIEEIKDMEGGAHMHARSSNIELQSYASLKSRGAPSTNESQITITSPRPTIGSFDDSDLKVFTTESAQVLDDIERGGKKPEIAKQLESLLTDKTVDLASVSDSEEDGALKAEKRGPGELGGHNLPSSQVELDRATSDVSLEQTHSPESELHMNAH